MPDFYFFIKALISHSVGGHIIVDVGGAGETCMSSDFLFFVFGAVKSISLTGL